MDPSKVQSNLDNMRKRFEGKMTDFQAELKQASRRNPGSIAALNSEFTAFKVFLCESFNLLQAEVAALASGVDRLEMRSRRNMLLVHGVPEQKDEDTTALVVAKLSTKMSDVDLSVTNIRTSYRMCYICQDLQGKNVVN